MSRSWLLRGLLVLCAVPAGAQTGTAPVLKERPTAPYPERALAAHVGGEAVVAFAINPDGKTAGVHAVSGPQLLTRALVDEIRGWRFVTPLPRDAEKDFVATYTYSIVDSPQQVAAETGKPKSGVAAGEDTDALSGPMAAVSGVVHSANDRQIIDVTPSVKEK